MKKHILLIATLISSFSALQNTLICQQYEFYVGGGTSWFTKDEHRQVFESYSLSPISGSDSLFLRTPTRFEQIIRGEYEVLPNFELGAKISWPVAEQLSIGTGVGLFSLNFRAGRDFVSSSSVSIGPSDTIVFSSNNPGSGFVCDYYTNQPIFDIQNFNSLSIIGLAIPLSINYSIVPQRLYLSLGASLRTPIYSSNRRNYFLVDMETDSDGLIACTYREVDSKDRTGRDFNDLVISGDFEIAGWLKRWGASLAISNWTSSVFSKLNGENTFFGSDQKTTPGFYTLRLKYRLGDFSKEK